MSPAPPSPYVRLAPLLSLRRRRAQVALAAALGALRSAEALVERRRDVLASAEAKGEALAGWLAHRPEPVLLESALAARLQNRDACEAAVRAFEAAVSTKDAAGDSVRAAVIGLKGLEAKDAALAAAGRADRARGAARRDEQDFADRTLPGAGR